MQAIAASVVSPTGLSLASAATIGRKRRRAQAAATRHQRHVGSQEFIAEFAEKSGLSDDRLDEIRDTHETISNLDKMTGNTAEHEKEMRTVFQNFVEEWMTQTSSQLSSLEFRMQMVMEHALHHAEQIGSLQGECEDLKAQMGVVQLSGLPRREQEDTVQKLDTQISSLSSPADLHAVQVGPPSESATIPASTRRSQEAVDAAFDKWLTASRRGKGKGKYRKRRRKRERQLVRDNKACETSIF
eukprot:gnl/TRDRNA2_/TRDRNA2_176873_c3_seq2.p1 gnl/TRDRNA2_/TRDRNA2_176873_c3~~gnl/TRDRNA2_/TRDRNA2_176873_c3_seq2.p1  ORF type:complete len:243 (-),score=42.44 gnl/TRDRNA2_/TRDRNA2_176873_c3_seq2:58-786(-)